MRKPGFPRIILASTSPRRIEMLRAIRLPFRAVAPDTDESPVPGERPAALVRRLACDKALSVASRLRRVPDGCQWLVIAADTIVVAPDGRKILGKPRDRREAFRMLKSLAGRTHVVHTGYCLLIIDDRGNDHVGDRASRGGKAARGLPIRLATQTISRVVSSRVTMRKLAPADLARYLDTGESMDKAGAYAAQGFGATLIERIRGSYSNVVGLPLAQLLGDLETALGVAPFSWPGARARQAKDGGAKRLRAKRGRVKRRRAKSK